MNHPKFHGADITPAETKRLTPHLQRFIAYVSDGAEHTLGEVAKKLGMMETAASARYRQIKSFGYTYERRKDDAVPGLWHYRVTGWPK